MATDVKYRFFSLRSFQVLSFFKPGYWLNIIIILLAYAQMKKETLLILLCFCSLTEIICASLHSL